MNSIEVNFQVPSFIPIPSSETMMTISIIIVVIGLFLVILGVILQKGKQKTNRAAWVCIGIGVLLIINHGIQLLFRVF
ncbi:hypothetical protein [Bacillus sp. FJAT-52991]|uniref:LPXTG cell wall anchor domain-containing protein n=1 Tax=Bacillus kandeliae TaxID=3129297 RepID=A0ABZ2N8B5_9BACI